MFKFLHYVTISCNLPKDTSFFFLIEQRYFTYLFILFVSGSFYFILFLFFSFFFHCHEILSEGTWNYFEDSSGIKVRVTLKRLIRKSHINIPIVHCHCVNPLLYSFGAPHGFCWWVFRIYRLIQSFSCFQSNIVLMPGANYTCSSIKFLGKEIIDFIIWYFQCWQ